MQEPANDLTLILRSAGEDEVRRVIEPRIYDELRRLAQAQMARESGGHTLQATALVHEAWLKLVGKDGAALEWSSRAHFFGAAARAMRQILVDRARRVRSEQHGGAMRRQPLESVDAAFDPDALDFEALDAALERFAQQDERAARVVELRYFAGLSVEDTASALGTSERTVAREWNVAKAWLVKEMAGRG